jgi:predicted DNA-binding transcriptional regulator AlpA
MSANPIDRPPIMDPNALWGVADIEAWSGFGETKARQMVCEPDFPRPVKLLGDTSHPRWWAGEVWEWARSKRRAS